MRGEGYRAEIYQRAACEVQSGTRDSTSRKRELAMLVAVTLHPSHFA